jgi:hypothetical protein
VFLLGDLAGIFMEKRQTTDALVNVGTQLERIQTPPAIPVTVPSAKKSRKQSIERPPIPVYN